MRPIAIGKYRKPEQTVPSPIRLVTPSHIEEASREMQWDTEYVRRIMAIRRWRGLSTLPMRQTVEAR